MSEEHQVTRRRLLGTAAAGAAVVAVPGADAEAARKHRPHRTPRRRRVDVVVVGAGFAGLSAAGELVHRGKSVLVLEARKRVGGRVLNHSLGGGKVVEIGGQWVGPTQDHIILLGDRMGVPRYKTHIDGNHVYLRSGNRTEYPNSGPTGEIPPDPLGLPDAAKAIVQLDQMASELPVDRPQGAARAVEYDSQTMETWIGNNTTTSTGRFLLTGATKAIFAAEPRDLSLLYVLGYIRRAGTEGTAGTLERLIGTTNAAQEQRFVGGSQLVAIKAAKRLGRRVKLGHPVRRISQHKGYVDVFADGMTVRARHVVVTVPPALQSSIRWDPILPADRALLLQRFPQGNVIKCLAVYDKPFWRDKGLSGFYISDREPIFVGWDNSPPDGRPGILLGFIEGHDARVYARKSPAETRAAVLDVFAHVVGDAARSPTEFIAQNWAGEQWTRGCYVGFTPPGVLTDFGDEIRRPFGRVHWAGTETADYWQGYMDGAVRSGERVSLEIP